MSTVESTCRTCGKASDQEDGSDLYPMYSSTEYIKEWNMIQEEFGIWNLNISQDDGLPQKICLTCFDSFCQIHNFRKICQEAQMNFGELCTGLDIIINQDYGDIDLDNPEDHESEQTITVQEHYYFPPHDRFKIPDSPEPETDSNFNTNVDSDEKRRMEIELQDTIEEMTAVLPEFKQYQCEYCMDVVSFDDPETLNKHYNILHSSEEPYPCPKCDKCFNKKVKRNSHARVHFRIILKCEICGKMVRGGKHMMAQHNEYYHVEKPRQCQTCGKKFESTTLKRFNYHMAWHDDTKLRKCKYCHKKFIQITHLAVHERMHSGETPFECTHCDLKFKDPNVFNRHRKTHGLEKLNCPKCPKKFFHKHGLTLHMKIHNPNNKVLHCEPCQRSFRSILNLKKHNHKKHGGPKPQSGPITHAGSTILNILKKRQIKVPSGKPNKCKLCPAAFVLRTQLLKHLKIHDEKKPFPCDLCKGSYKCEAHVKIRVNSVNLNKKTS